MDLHDLEEDDDLTVTSHGTPPSRKESHFEFTNSQSVMQIARLWITLQVMALVCDNSSTQLPIVFRIMCRGALYYAGRFHTRPFVDFVYVLQWFSAEYLSGVPAQPSAIEVEDPSSSAPGTPSAGDAPGVGRRMLRGTYLDFSSVLEEEQRRLDAAAYVVTDPPEGNTEVLVDYLSERSWHSVKAFSHFFLSALACIMAVLFTLRLWQIHDYTDRSEVRSWLASYIADGWWRRGLAKVSWSISKGALAMSGFAFLLFAMAREFTVNAVPDSRMYGGAVSMLLSFVALGTFLGALGISAAEGSFVRYVSQNVSYTSIIILKRVIKSKVDIGILLMLVLYMPSLYNFIQSFMVVLDWNDTHAAEYRRSVNYFVPCYFMAFPPYTEQNKGEASCANFGTISGDQAPRAEGFYKDAKILPCDSYLGVAIFTTGFIFFAFLVCFYYYFFYSFVSLATKEFQESRWSSTVRTLYSIRDEMTADYVDKFGPVNRWGMDLRLEAWTQLMYFYEMMFAGFNITVRMALQAVWMASYPLRMLGSAVYRSLKWLWGEFRDNCLPIPNNDDDGFGDGDLEMLGQGSFTFTESIGEGSSLLQGNGPSQSMSNAGSRIMVQPSMSHSIEESINTVNATDAIYHSFVFASHTMLKLLLLCLGQDFFDRLSVKYTLMKNDCYRAVCASNEKKKSKKGGKVGIQQGSWRKALSIESKFRKMRQLQKRIIDEIRISRTLFTSDHALTITCFDTVIDSSGIFTLVCQYRWHSMYWTMVLFTEMTMYTFVCAYSGLNAYWIDRISYVMYINLAFGVLTYFVKPFTDDVDRWIDFFARMLINVFCLGITYYDEQVPKGTNDAIAARMYSPFDSLPYLMGVGGTLSTTAALVDVFLTAYTYIFTIYILKRVGFFRFIERKIRATIFAYHDHILNYIIDKLETRNIGFENIFDGLQLVQQWDDIIMEQRSYGLIPYPDVRPADLVPVSVKLMEMKWASAFNLTLPNMRSSLGLTLLHTTMCGADSEVSRWLIHMYPDMLNVEDFQKDTPLFIALKESSYFLLKYSEQLDGCLADDTTYEDDDYYDYYPEIDEHRDAVQRDGEYVPEFGTHYKLDALEHTSLEKYGYFIETKKTKFADYKPSFRNFKTKLGKYATQEEIEAEKEAKAQFEAEQAAALAGEDGDSKMTPEQLREEAKRSARAAAAERASLFKKRFPEDSFTDNFEMGQVAAWHVVGLTVNDDNNYIDKNFSSWRHDKKYFEDDLDPTVEEVEYEYYEEHKPLDMRVNVRSLRCPKDADEKAALIPAGDYNLKEMADWDILKKKKRGEGLKQVMADVGKFARESKDKALGRVTISMRNEKDREVRFKMCKFAEILLSTEIQERAGLIDWDIDTYKELNKLASIEQGRIAQNLAMSCNLNVPPRFTRISEWTMGVSTNVFDEHPAEDFNPFVKAAVKVTNIAAKAASAVEVVASAIPNLGDKRKDTHKRHLMDLTRKRVGDHPDQTEGFNDRVIHYLAECYVASRERLCFKDCELSVAGRRGWRAIARALRRNNCTFVVPSVFVSPKAFMTTHLDLSRNELDCGDAILLADIILYKQTLAHLDLRYNRIGSRGCMRMMKVMAGHASLHVLHLDHNRIGPAAGRDIGLMLKEAHHLHVLTMSWNRMGELVQYKTPFLRERVSSAARDIFAGMRKNHHLKILDLSYNKLGPDLADSVPIAVMKHPHLIHLNLSGNELGAKKGSQLVFALGNDPGGQKEVESKLAMQRELDRRRMRGEEVNNDVLMELAERMDAGDLFEEKDMDDEDDLAPVEVESKAAKKKREEMKEKKKGKKKKRSLEQQRREEQKKLDRPNFSSLAYIGLADNQLGTMAGYGLGSMVRNCKSLTALDVSRNNIGYTGGVAFTDGLERVFCLEPRDFNKLALYNLEQQKYEGRFCLIRREVYSNLTSLDISHNNLGPLGCQGLMYCMGSPNCTITELNVSRNPLGYTIEKGGESALAAMDTRVALSSVKVLTKLDISDTHFRSVDAVPVLGALNRNSGLKRLELRDIELSEPSCLQAAHGMTACMTLTVVDLSNASMGAKGGLMVANRMHILGKRLTYLNLNKNALGPVSCIPLGQCLEDPMCSIKTLYIEGNSIADEGAKFIIKGMKANVSLTDTSLSDNALTGEIASQLADVARGLFRDGKKVCDCQLKRLCVSDNPRIGFTGAKLLAKALTSPNFTFVEMANVGAGPGTAHIIADGIRNVDLQWNFIDISGNNMSRSGLNHIFWAARQNRSLRVLLVGDNSAGSHFGTAEDRNLNHGIAVQRAIMANTMIRELDLSYNAMSSEAGDNVMKAILQNHTIRRLSLRGNKIDDTVADSLFDVLCFNDVLEELDLGENMLGYDCVHVMADALSENRALKILCVDYNNLNAAGTSFIEIFKHGLEVNTSLRSLIMDGNKLGASWGIGIAGSLSRNNTLTQLSFRDNRLDTSAGMALYKSYDHAPFLKELAVSSDEVGEKCFDHIRRTFHRKRAHFEGDDQMPDLEIMEELGGILEDYYVRPDKRIK